MISSLRGTVLSAVGTSVVVEVGGVGYAVQVTPQHALALRVGSDAFLRTAMIVRDDDMSLFGFVDGEQLELFDLLRGVTGVGPKSALGVLAALSPAEVARAVDGDDDAAFRKVSGIGPKTAKLIVVSLSGKLARFAVAATHAAPAASGGGATERLVAALTGLGWSEKLAAQAADDIVAEASESERADVPLLLRRALAVVGRTQGVR